jgi:hypothetical protein
LLRFLFYLISAAPCWSAGASSKQMFYVSATADQRDVSHDSGSADSIKETEHMSSFRNDDIWYTCLKSAMHQARTAINWSSLLDSKGRPHHDIRTIILQSLSPFSETVTVNKKPGVLLLVHQDHGTILYGYSKKDISTVVTKMKKRLNGTSTEYSMCLVELPSGKPFTITEKALRSFAHQEHRKMRFGQEVFNRILSERRSYIMIANIMSHVSFETIAHQKNNQLTLEPLWCGYEASGIYFIREHRNGSSFGEIVYVGMSVGRLGKTAKDHFRQWSGKDHHLYEGSRGEDRGKWFQKIDKGYHYDIGTINMIQPKDFNPTAFRLAVLKIESYFIHALNPRDNFMKKQEPAENLSTLFDELPKVETPSYDDDDLPF